MTAPTKLTDGLEAAQGRLLELAERCEKATGSSVYLDAKIREALQGVVTPHGDRYSGLPYTASIDAAMTLVPEGFDWIIGRTNGGLTIHAEVGSREQIFGNTAALALCAASLRARSAS